YFDLLIEISFLFEFKERKQVETKNDQPRLRLIQLQSVPNGFSCFFLHDRIVLGLYFLMFLIIVACIFIIVISINDYIEINRKLEASKVKLEPDPDLDFNTLYQIYLK